MATPSKAQGGSPPTGPISRPQRFEPPNLFLISSWPQEHLCNDSEFEAAPCDALQFMTAVML
jgi:hypothetical protein